MYDARYYQENREKLITKQREYRKNNKEKIAAYNIKWDKENPEKVAAKHARRRTRKAGGGGSYTGDEFIELCDYYGNICLCCGLERKLTADHVIPVKHLGSSNIDNIQPLCKSCNSGKGTKTIDYRV